MAFEEDFTGFIRGYRRAFGRRYHIPWGRDEFGHFMRGGANRTVDDAIIEAGVQEARLNDVQEPPTPAPKQVSAQVSKARPVAGRRNERILAPPAARCVSPKQEEISHGAKEAQ